LGCTYCCSFRGCISRLSEEPSICAFDSFPAVG
jgi:hypothetical protein